jgi:hypothetical protein
MYLSVILLPLYIHIRARVEQIKVKSHETQTLQRGAVHSVLQPFALRF